MQSKQVFIFGRNERIRTSDPFVPNEVRYRAALHSECSMHYRGIFGRMHGFCSQSKIKIDELPSSCLCFQLTEPIFKIYFINNPQT